MSSKKRTTMYFEPDELEQLKAELGVKTDAEAVRKAIEMALRTLAYRRIASFAGSEKGRPLVEAPRRHEPAVRKTRGKPARAKKSA